MVRQVSPRGRRGGGRGPVVSVPLLALSVLLLGCAGRKPVEQGSLQNAEVAVEVESHNWSDVVIYLVRGTAAERLGMVGSLKTQTFVLPYRRLGGGADVQLRAYPIGGPRAFTSEIIRVQPGQWIRWTLENDLTRSFLAVY
jgi:hypothetical protein